MNDLMVPSIATILDRREETPDTMTYHLGWREERDRFAYRPGQFFELSVFGAGEAPFCLASSPHRKDGIEATVRRCGRVTDALATLLPADLVYKFELEEWGERADMTVRLTVDCGDADWSGCVGLVPVLFDRVELKPESTLAYVCGPPIMIKFVIQDLLKRGFAEDRIISTLERMMQCGVGKCNHCCVGHRYLCRDGPVFNYREIREMWE